MPPTQKEEGMVPPTQKEEGMVPPTQKEEGMPPTTQIPVFAKVTFFYARKRLRKNKEVWIQKSMLRQFLR